MRLNPHRNRGRFARLQAQDGTVIGVVRLPPRREHRLLKHLDGFAMKLAAEGAAQRQAVYAHSSRSVGVA
jgi:hypothetical protein